RYDRFHIKAHPRNTVVWDTLDGHAAKQVGLAIQRGTLPFPFCTHRHSLRDAGDQRGLDVGHIGEDLGPIPTHGLMTTESTLRVGGELALIIGVEATCHLIQIMMVDRLLKAL